MKRSLTKYGEMRFFTGLWKIVWACGFAVAVTIATFFVHQGIGVLFGKRYLLVLFMLPIVLSSYVGGIVSGLVSTLLSAAIVDFFLMPPIHSYRIANELDVFHFIMLTSNGVLICILSEVLRRTAVSAKQRAVALDKANVQLEEEISERRRMEERLKIEKSLLRCIIDSASDLIYIKDRNSVYIGCNRASEDFIGIPESEQIGKTDFDFFDREMAEEIRQEDRKVVEEGKPIRIEEWVTTRDGDEVFMDTIKAPYFDPERKILGLVGVSRDITDRKLTESVNKARLHLLCFAETHIYDEVLEATLDEAEKLSDSLVGFYHFLETDQKTISLQSWSTRTKREFCKAEGKGLHYDVSEAGVWAECIRERRPVIHNDYPSLPHKKGLPPSHAPLVRELVVPVFRGENIVAIIGVGNKPRNYTPFDVEALSLLADFAWEIMERKRSEERISLLATIVESSDDAIIGITLDGNILSWNRGAERLYGYGERDVIGRSVSIIIPQDLSGELLSILDRIKQGLHVEHHETEWLRKDSERINVSITVSPIHDARGEIIGASTIIHDITERKHVEGELILAREAAEAANRAKGEFLASMSHEIKTPINGIIGMSHLLRMSDVSKEQRELLNAIDISSDKLLRLINDILDLSKIEAGKTDLEEVEFSPRKCINDAVLLQITQIRRKKLKIDSDISQAIPDMLVGDEVCFSQIISNLLENAVKFTEAGSITITSGVIHHDEENVVIRLSVADTGIGMSGETMDKIFTPFSQADASTTRRFGGTGLGLAICRELATLMGGHIWAESSLGEGSVFHVVIPFKAPECHEGEIRAALPPLEPHWEGKPLSVLIAEDDSINRTYAEGLLRKMGHSVVCVNDGEEAIGKWRSDRFDCILMDVRMPGVDGIQATELIRSVEKRGGAHIPIIACTASPVRGDTNRILEAGFDAYLCKPLRWNNLFPALLNCCDTVSQRESLCIPSNIDRPEKFLNGWPETLPGMDMADALERVEGDGQLYIHLLENFVEGHGQDPREIREAVLTGETEKWSFILHKLKGIAGLLALRGLQDISLKLEKDLAAGASETADRLLDDLDGSFKQVAKNVENLISLVKTEEAGKEGMEEERMDLSGIIAELETLMERGNIDSRQHVAPLRKVLPDGRFVADLDRIQFLLDKFDFKGAKATLRQLVSRHGERG